MTSTDLLGDPVPETPPMTAPLPFRVFRLNDCEWWMARTLAEAIEDWRSCTGIEPDPSDEPRELTDAELDANKFFDPDDPAAPRRTFREELEIRARGATGPQFFATTEC